MRFRVTTKAGEENTQFCMAGPSRSPTGGTSYKPLKYCRGASIFSVFVP